MTHYQKLEKLLDWAIAELQKASRENYSSSGHGEASEKVAYYRDLVFKTQQALSKSPEVRKKHGVTRKAELKD